ncbi:MAG TPA: DUF5724 domain-containing protein [Chthonomonadaceae bacterium]|nr:DUF5724 domain-containing protein [Chthonomonadaceae bacterium]
MLKPDQAQERLKAFHKPDGKGRRLERARTLPAPLKEIVLALYGLDANGKSFKDYLVQQEAHRRSQERLVAMSPEERASLFACLFPGIERHVEGGWQLFSRLPYQSGYVRKAFRVRDARAVPSDARKNWLIQMLSLTQGYEQDVAWYAAWTPYLNRGWGADPLGILFAAAIEVGGEEGETVFNILLDSGRGEHEIGTMGRHVSRALLIASRPEGWEFVEKMLLAAQRQEGLRQVILETIDEAHPEAFRRILRLIVDQDLLRFSATVRAVYVWFGFNPETVNVRQGNEMLRQVIRFLEDADARAAALCDEDSNLRFLALWTLAFEDAYAALAPAAQMLADPNAEHRLVAVRLLALLGLPEAQKALLVALDDPELRVAEEAFAVFRYGVHESLDETDLFERLERLLPRVSKERKSEVAAALAQRLGDRSPRRLIPYLSSMEPYTRRTLALMLAKEGETDAECREMLFALTGDPSSDVREQALKAIAQYKVTEAEVQKVERLLTRKASDLRRGVLSLLMKQDDAHTLESAERLLAAGDAGQRLAGLELLREMAKAERAPDRCRQQAARYLEERPRRTEAEEELIAAFLTPETEVPTLENGLGLFDPAQRTKPAQPRAIPRLAFATEASVALLQSLDEVIHAHRETTVIIADWHGQPEQILGNLNWGFPDPNIQTPAQEDVVRLPLHEVWEAWWTGRPASQRDRDGFELLRAIAGGNRPHKAAGPPLDMPALLQQGFDMLKSLGHTDQAIESVVDKLREQLAPLQAAVTQKQADGPAVTNRYPAIRKALLQWMLRLHPPAGAVDFLLDAFETQLALVPKKLMEPDPNAKIWHGDGWRGRHDVAVWLALVRQHRDLVPEAWTDAHHRRLYGLLRWMDEPGTDTPRFRPQLGELLLAYQAGGANEADLLDHLIGPRPTQGYWNSGFGDLQLLSARKVPTEYGNRKLPTLYAAHPILQDLVQRCRARIIEVESRRGEMPTEATQPALALRYTGGMDTLLRLLAVYGPGPFIRTYSYGDRSQSRPHVFSELIRRTFPGEEDTPVAFAARAQAAKIPAQRLVDLAVYAPQWANHVECALGWAELEEAVWWIHAHTKDNQWRVDQEIRATWEAEVRERTPLSGEDLLEGAVDVDWFHRAYADLGPERWTVLDTAAKYASGGGGHKRATLFADAMLGRIGKAELMGRLENRNQDAVRALGLLPLAEGAERERDLLERYQQMQEFIRTSRQFGSMRQVSEKTAARIGMENLSRTAGYPDPARLEWAMEAQAVADLAQGPVTATSGEVAVTLSINEWGKPQVAYTKQGKPTKSLPANLKKEPAFVELQERKRGIDRQASRMRKSLEEAMCRGDRFTGAELRTLMGHPVLAPMLRSLVFLGDKGLAGYPVEGGWALESHDGATSPVPEAAGLAIAHPYDLLQTGEWHLWQKDCFLRERIQPFKQVFRELYVLTPGETDNGTISRRYDGHQVQPKQAMALFGGRGWVVHPEEGVRRTFHKEGLTAWITFFEGFTTPAEVEGLTIEGVGFSKKGQWTPMPLAEIPPRLFSEVMRDVDLVVSVAHQGGVDPEASASTVEMRTALLREACALLKIENVRLQSAHVLIDGHLGTYTVHLGSAVVHRQPGGHVCIVPVHSQHRGRLFLPFADDDPRSAEVLSKVILLAKDKEIKDPTILEQILPRRQ